MSKLRRRMEEDMRVRSAVSLQVHIELRMGF
jgi:hypothetical protein